MRKHWIIFLSLALALIMAVSLMATPATEAITALSASGTGGGSSLTFGEFVGSNSFFDENQTCYDMLGNVREYHPWHLTEWTTGVYTDGKGGYDNSIVSMKPRATFRDSWGIFDNYYRTMREKGIEVTIVIKDDAYGHWGRPDHQNPDGTKSTVPASYLGHAQSLFQHAARYGSNKNIDPSLVRTAEGTEKKIGLGYLRYYENYNEPANGNFTGAQYAAMLSADYDGHMGTLGSDVGIKTADPNAKVVFGGSWVGWFSWMSNGRFTSEFLADMMAWFDANRTLDQWRAAHGGSSSGYVKYPFDVVSAHYYSEIGGNGMSAEAYRAYNGLKVYVDNCKKIFPDKEYFFSEFGWNTAPNSFMRAETPGNTTYEVQGRWLVRQYLLAAAAGIDQARQFMMPDTSNDRNNTGSFATCGLINGIQGSADFKPSWYYIGTMRDVLKDASLSNIEILSDGGWSASGGSTESNGPWALRFNSVKNTDRIFAMWLPTSLGDQGGANSQNYSITVPAGYKSATLITMQDKVKWGQQTDISGQIQNGKLTVSISEKPIFVVLSESGYTARPINDFINPGNFTTWTLTPGSGNPALLFDERRTDISRTPMPNMQNAWDPGGMNRYAIIDLAQKYDLTNIYVWDREGALAAGKVLAVYAYTGAKPPTLTQGGMSGAQVQSMLSGNGWKRVAWFDFSSWESWVEVIVNVETRYLVLGFENGPSVFYDNPWPCDWLPVPEMVVKGAPAAPATPATPTTPTTPTTPATPTTPTTPTTPATPSTPAAPETPAAPATPATPSPAPSTGGSMDNFNPPVNNYTPGMFTDVNENAWYGFNDQKVIATAYNHGLMTGNSATTFNPTGNMTIAEAITIATRVHCYYWTRQKLEFTPTTPWYQGNVNYAIDKGIISATDFTDYTRAITRAEMAYIFSRCLPISEFTSRNTVNYLPDVNNSTPYKKEIFMLYEAGVVGGSDAAGTFKPNNNIIRAEAAAIISRVILPGIRINGRTYG